MNIFAISNCPIEAGTKLPDKLCVKMILESAQMLSTACRTNGVNDPDLYNVAHLNHPCSKWCRASQENFLWLYFHGLAIAEEYTRRYGKVHKSQAVIELAGNYFDKIPPGKLTPFAQAMPQEHTHCTDATIAYKRYMKTKPYWGEKAFRKGRDFTEFYD